VLEQIALNPRATATSIRKTREHILQVPENISAERIDHGMTAADREDFTERESIRMTICPCAYIHHTTQAEIFPRIRKLFDADIKITNASDDPTYIEDN
jgi:adenosine deaminase